MSEQGSSRGSADETGHDTLLLRAPPEVTVIYSRDSIVSISGRIARAYLRRHPQWARLGSIDPAWELAAARLLEASDAVCYLPVDPELFVAVLSTDGPSADPRLELTERGSRTRYLKAVRAIIRRLRKELNAELRLAECRLNGGLGLDDLLDDAQDRLSALTRYILAFRASRFDLVLKYQAAAGRQHHSCPLYREASRTLLPEHAYPLPNIETESDSNSQDVLQFSLN